MKRCAAVLLALTYSCHAADWLTYAGSPRRTGWVKPVAPEKPAPRKGPFGIFEDDDDEDPNEVFGTPLRKNTIGAMPLVWKLKLDASAFAAPLIVQKIITQRGFKELAIFATNAGLIVLDADLGRLFWKREDLRSTATPVVAQTGGVFKKGFPRYAVYALDDKGTLHTLRLDDGFETEPVKSLVADATSLNRAGGLVYTTNANGIWSWQQAYRVSGAGAVGGVAIGDDGTVYAASARGLLTLTPELKLKDSYAPPSGVAEVTPIVNGTKVIGATKDGCVFVLNGPKSACGGQINGLAAWGTRWIYASTNHGITAFRLDRNRITQAWRWENATPPSPPVILNGMIFAAAGSTLYALDATTGKMLYSSANIMTSPAAMNGITVANDRVYIGTSDGTVYCFGYPIDQ